MKRHVYSPENLLPAYKKLFGSLLNELPEISGNLKCRRTVTRHGTCTQVLVWTIWDKRQMAATSNPGHFAYSFNYDPVRFESIRKDWVVKLHMNTTRVYHNATDVRRYLLKRIPPVCPKGFSIKVHERFIDVYKEIDFAEDVKRLPELFLPFSIALIRGTFPVLDPLFDAFSQQITAAERAAIIAGRTPSRKPATKGSLVIQKSLYNRGINARLRTEVLAKHGYKCGLCGGELKENDVHIDHILPVAKGGLTTLNNLQPTHVNCNLKKGSKTQFNANA